LNKLSHYAFELKIFNSSNGFEVFRNPTTWFTQGIVVGTIHFQTFNSKY
jgi:hypothetical protein